MSKRLTIKEIFLFDDKWLLLIGIPLVSMITAIAYFPYYEEGVSFWLGCLPIGFIYTIIYWFIFRYLIYWLILSFNRRSQLLIRIAIEVTAVILGNLLMGKLIQWVLIKINYKLDPPEAKEITMIFFSVILCLMIIAIYEAIRFYTQLLNTETEKEKLEKANIQSLLMSLQNQVNPHFLFNSLNTLAYLIPITADKAQRFIKAFSDVYRYILDTESEVLVTLEQELGFLDSYNLLLKERFGQNFHIELNINKDNLDLYIPPISLQILVENAVKHNVVSKDYPLTVRIWTANKNELYVQNRIVSKDNLEESNKIGLKNIKERFKLLSNKDIIIENTGDLFTVVLPLLMINEEENVSDV